MIYDVVHIFGSFKVRDDLMYEYKWKRRRQTLRSYILQDTDSLFFTSQILHLRLHICNA